MSEPKSLRTFAILAWLAASLEGQDKIPQAVAIDSVLSEVQLALAEVQRSTSGARLPGLQAVELTLQAVTTSSVGGTFKLFVISFGKKVKRERMHQLTLTLTPPPRDTGTRLAGVSSQLAAIILAGAQGVEEARNREPRLEPESLTAEIAFVVVRESSGKGSLELTPVSLELGGDLTKQSVHKIKVTYKRKGDTGTTTSSNANAAVRVEPDRSLAEH